MKILVSLHELVMGGTTVNALELAAALRDQHGHELRLFASPGPMVRLAQELGLRWLPAPPPGTMPSQARMRALRAEVRVWQPDLVHAWETWPCMDAYCGVHLPQGLPLLVTDMQMSLTRVLPRDLHTTFGTPRLVREALADGRQRARLMVPPVDLRANHPGAVDAEAFKQRFGVRRGELTVVTVSRLAHALKGESLRHTIAAVRTLGRELPVRLLIVGDGEARAALGALAQSTNDTLQREAVVLTGALHDPRPAYAAADVVIGMGGSALRAMAFAKPVIVVGERGYSAVFSPYTADVLQREGMFGVGDEHTDPQSLLGDLCTLAEQPAALPELGSFGRRFVEENYALDTVARQLSEACRAAVDDPPARWHESLDALRTASRYLRERRFLWRASAPAPMECVDA